MSLSSTLGSNFGAAGKARSSLAKQDRFFGLLISLPGLTALLLVILFPVLFTVFTSFYDYTLIHPTFDTFVGLQKYEEGLSERYLRASLWVTLKFVVASLVIEFVIGFTVALMLNTVTRGKSIYYLILLMPLLVNPVIVGLIWRMILHTELGIANYLLETLGLPSVNWLGGTNVAFWTVVLVDIWHQVSFMAILLLAGLSTLPKDPYEAARLEGSSALRSFIYLTLPMMRPVISVALLLRMIFAIRTFDIVYVMTKGGPGIQTDLLSYYIYRSAFYGLDVSKASAIGVMLLLGILALSAYLYRFMRSTT